LAKETANTNKVEVRGDEYESFRLRRGGLIETVSEREKEREERKRPG
jgi:hypothetical protein